MKIVKVYYDNTDQLYAQYHINDFEAKHGEYIRYNNSGLVVERVYYKDGIDITSKVKLEYDYNKVVVKLTLNIPVFPEDV